MSRRLAARSIVVAVALAITGGASAQNAPDGGSPSTPEAAPADEPLSPDDAPAGSEHPGAAQATALKIAVVTIGDPDDALRHAARGVERSLEESGELVLPGDPGIREALLGEPGPSEDDGLATVRRDRRRLGADPTSDAQVLSALGRRVGAIAVVAVSRRGTDIEVVVLDVSTGRFYDDEVTLPSGSVVSFVRARARASGRRVAGGAAPEPEAGPPPSHRATGADHPRARPAPREREEEAAEDHEDHRSFLEKAWPYFVAGILLIGVVTYALVSTGAASPASPVLRFQPGGR